MIGRLPTSLNINGVEHEIRTDYRDCLVIIQAFSDPDLSEQEKVQVMLCGLYKDVSKIDDLQTAAEQAIWFLNCGDTIQEPTNRKRVYDWEQDEQIIFSGINKVANKEVRQLDYLHFWTFIGYFQEIQDGTFSYYVSLRTKLNNHKKLDKDEQKFYNENKARIDLKKTLSKEQQAEIDYLNKLLG